MFTEDVQLTWIYIKSFTHSSYSVTKSDVTEADTSRIFIQTKLLAVNE